MLVRRTIVAALLATAMLASSSARANGRFPEANNVFVSPDDPNYVLLRVSFGLLVSRDGGKTWSWACEQLLGLSGIEDPMYAFTPTSAIVGATFLGIRVSRDHGCSWPKVELDPRSVYIDLTQRPAERGRIVVFDSAYDRQDADGGFFFRSQLYETTDDGVTFKTFGAQMDSSLLGYTVDLAPSDANRIYVSATRNSGAEVPTAVLLTSTDNAATWAENQLPLVNGERGIYIAAVDPTNPDRLYVRTNTAIDKPGRLLVSDDAAKTFRTVFTSKAALLGFALSPDGQKVYLGGKGDGLNVASTADFVFRQASTVEVQCITATTEHVWVCSNEKSGFIAARTKDDGATFEGQSHFSDIIGPQSCPSSPDHDKCVGSWPSQRELLLGGRDAGADAGPDAVPGGAPNHDSGCSCRAGATHGWAGGLAAAALVVGFAARRRRRP